jgi:hypothetical protein
MPEPAFPPSAFQSTALPLVAPVDPIVMQEIGFARDSPLEGNGFKLSVPHETGSGFEALSEFGADRLSAPLCHPSSRLAVVGLGKTNRAVSAARGAHSPPNEGAPALSARHRGTESSNPFPPAESPQTFTPSR